MKKNSLRPIVIVAVTVAAVVVVVVIVGKKPPDNIKADALAAEGVEADSFLLLNVPDEMLIQRVVGRRLDPETGEIYHMDYSPPPAEIADRLVSLGVVAKP